MRVCTIDIGTNSVRALVADVEQHGLVRVVRRESHITRLGEELSGRGLLSEAAMERTAEAVQQIARAARDLRAERFKLVATSAARNAANASELRDRIRRLTSLETKVITGQEEAKYVCEGALSSLEVTEECALLADIGGGSTELIIASRHEEPILTSVPTGAVYLTEEFIRGDPPLEEELSSAYNHARDTLGKAYAGLPSGADELIGLGGTVTTIPPILMEMRRYDASRVHNYTVTRDRVVSVLERLAALSLPQRKEVTGLEAGREDIIVGGLVILKALLEVTGFEEVRVSDRGILFGLALSMVEGAPPGSGRPKADTFRE